MIRELAYMCPYCGEEIETSVDLSAGDQDYIEDCQVCCRPIECRLRVHDEHDYSFETRRDDE